MTIRSNRWPAGIPCWLDLQTPDVAKAEAFYGPLLGWDFMNDDTGEFGGYAVAQVKDVAAAGLGPAQMEGVPSAWTMYFATDDAEQTAAAITQNGGQIVLPVGEIGDLGRICVAMDPTGAAFGLWEAGTHIGSNITSEPGGLMWEDLRTPDPDAARAFYGAVFGYEFTPIDMAGPTYTTFSNPGEAEVPMGGIGDMMGNDDAPPHWLLYLGVADANAAADSVKSLGGSVITGPFESPFGTMVGALDPAGAVFWMIQPPADMPTPER